MSESYLILNVDPEEFTKLFSSDDVVIGRLFKRLLTHMEPRPSASVICLKSQSQLSDTFRMVVDETSIVLDPTCGSGSAIRAAESLKAKHVRTREINPEFAATVSSRPSHGKRASQSGEQHGWGETRRASMPCHGHQRSGKWDYS